MARWESTREGKTTKYITRDCLSSDLNEMAGRKNCNDLKLDFYDEEHEGCWAICEGHLCNGTREVFGSMLLMALMMILS